MSITTNTTNKQSRPGDHSLPKHSGKKTKGKGKTNSSETLCSICENTIVEASETQQGEDALFCEGTCQAWVYRK